MKIYEAEQKDSLADLMVSNSIAMICDVINNDPIEITDVINESMAKASNRLPQEDLYYLNSILVSAGWNKNDDVFDVADLWAARDTPVDKPFNYMHEETDIIGHMIASAAMLEDGALLSEVPEVLPDRMDLVTSAVIYKTWADPAQSDRINDLIKQIDLGKLAVSMECVFRNFDYALVGPDGTHKVLARTEDSAFLTKHLRAYGGNGVYEGYKVGRLLRDLYFTGKGLVDKPANPRSVILQTDPFSGEPLTTIAMEKLMPETALAQEIVELKTSLIDEQAKAISLTAEIDGHKATIASLEVKVSELETAIATISQEKLTISQELQKMVADVKTMSRKAALMGAGADETKADELVSTFAEASDVMFASVVALTSTPVVVTEVEVETETEDETEALETVVEVEKPITVVEDSVSDKISVASEWIKNNFLTPKKGK